ncbi:unnamed protein product [Trypanosoma congolense IL3000]|uniref:WGS project CAEQ00000000 data, annotated contig 153 n=1 Tax=Trypanosoma congolense (strain IL3000) TaxID=1068625 RepID=F9W6W5_TRYCI|nr:unnamed protein product [Trypanosoma congolense IL3000]
MRFFGGVNWWWLPPVVWQRRLYRVPLGGSYFEEPLPRSLGASRGKGGLSALNMAASRRAKKKRQSLPRKKLHVPLTAAGLKARLKELAAAEEDMCDGSARSDLAEAHEGPHERFACVHESGAALKKVPGGNVEENEDEKVPVHVDSTQQTHILEDVCPPFSNGDESASTQTVTRVGFSVLGSDLDRLERDRMREYHQRGVELPKFVNIYASSSPGRESKRTIAGAEEGAGHDQQMRRGVEAAQAAVEKRIVSHSNTCTPPGTNKAVGDNVEDGEQESVCGADMLPAEANPHFPFVECCDDTRIPSSSNGYDIEQRVDVVAEAQRAKNDRKTPSTTYDAYNQRPADKRLVALRGAEFWDDASNRERLRMLTNYAEEGHAQEMLAEGVMDTSEVGYSTNKVRKETLLYFQAHPINEMIQESFARVQSIVPNDGGAIIQFPAGDPDADVDVPIAQARCMARELGLDLIRVGTSFTPSNDCRVVALCSIADHREHMRDMIRFKIKKLGVQPPPTKQGIEVPFRGGTHPHAIRFKSIGIAKHLLLGHVVRINLTDFGTSREGFPVFRSILDEVARQALQLRAYHTAGMVSATYNEIYCHLYPSTARSPKSGVTHPTQEQLEAVHDQRLLEEEREVYFDGLYDKKTPRERLTYLRKLQDGTAWADRDEGLSLQRQRDMKVMLGYLPKGNHELYAARGDVDIPAPFRASHPTSVDHWTHPRETNLEQAARGAAVLGKRLSMTVSEMHDRQETAENPTTLDRFYYRVQGPALEVGELKESLGLKNNRKKLPRQAPGWATLGMEKSPPQEPGYATK